MYKNDRSRKPASHFNAFTWLLSLTVVRQEQVGKPPRSSHALVQSVLVDDRPDRREKEETIEDDPEKNEKVANDEYYDNA